MIPIYLKIALRNLRRHKKYTVLNICALTLGLVPVILMLLFVQYELSFDRYHQKAERIYRLAVETNSPFGRRQSPYHPSPLAQTMVDNLPEVIQAIRLQPGGRRELQSAQKRFFEEKIIYTDPQIFDIFSIEFLKGAPQRALVAQKSVVISERMVEKYFGEQDPMDKTIAMDGYRDLKVTGVFKTIPKTSHFAADFLVPVDLLGPTKTPAGVFAESSWNFSNFFVYFLVREGADVRALESMFQSFIENYRPSNDLSEYRYFFQPLTQIHLKSHLTTELLPNGDITVVSLYLALAAVILLIACISYVCLATIRSAERAKEVGLRKVHGGRRWQLVIQFLSEALLSTLFASTAAVFITAVLLPRFNLFVDREMDLSLLLEGRLLLWLLMVISLVGVSSGSYSAFVLSALNPVMAIKSRFGGAKPSRFRDSMVVTQLFFLMLLVMATLVIRDQMQYARQKELGYRTEQIITLPVDSGLSRHLGAVKTELRDHPSVIAVSSSLYVPHSGFYSMSYHSIRDGKESSMMVFHTLPVDFDFIRLYEMEIVEGRDFSSDFSTDASEALIVNEAAVWYLAERWLRSFAYRVTLSSSTFLLALALLLAVMIFTVGHRAFRAANANPVEALRHE